MSATVFWLLFGINHFQLLHPPLFQLPPHHSRQRAYRSTVDIRHLKSRWVQLISGAHAADDRNPGLLRLQYQLYLSSDRIHRIHHIIIV